MTMTDTERQRANWYAAGRAAIGAAAIVAPGLLKTWIGAPAATPGGRVAARALGARDLALGVGTYLALAEDPKVAGKRWLQLCAASDAVDALATLLAIRRLPAKNALPSLGAAAAGAAIGLSLAAKA
jgi:hypothetical protein